MYQNTCVTDHAPHVYALLVGSKQEGHVQQTSVKIASPASSMLMLGDTGQRVQLSVAYAYLGCETKQQRPTLDWPQPEV